MSSLTGTKISNTYVGLLKTLDTTPLSATPKEISDGLGNASGVKLDNAGNLDVTNTVAFGSLKDTDEGNLPRRSCRESFFSHGSHARKARPRAARDRAVNLSAPMSFHVRSWCAPVSVSAPIVVA